MRRLRFKTVENYIALLRNINLTIKLNEIEKRRRDTSSMLRARLSWHRERPREKNFERNEKKKQVFIKGRLEGLPRRECGLFTR